MASNKASSRMTNKPSCKTRHHNNAAWPGESSLPCYCGSLTGHQLEGAQPRRVLYTHCSAPVPLPSSRPAERRAVSPVALLWDPLSSSRRQIGPSVLVAVQKLLFFVFCCCCGCCRRNEVRRFSIKEMYFPASPIRPHYPRV